MSKSKKSVSDEEIGTAEISNETTQDTTKSTDGLIVEKVWSGVPVWECTACGDATFDEARSENHVCSKPEATEK